MKRILFLVATLFLFSCNHYLQPNKSQSNLLNSAYVDAKTIYVDLLGKQYSQVEAKYNNVATQLDSLYAGDMKRNSNGALLIMDKSLIKGWAVRMGYHKGKNVLPASQVNIERMEMERYFEPRLRAEASIK